MIWLPPSVAILGAVALGITGHEAAGTIVFIAGAIAWLSALYFEAARIDQMYPKKGKDEN